MGDKITITQDGNDFTATITRNLFGGATSTKVYALQVINAPTAAMVGQFRVNADGYRNGDYGWHAVGRIRARDTGAIKEAIRTGEIDLRSVNPGAENVSADYAGADTQ